MRRLILASLLLWSSTASAASVTTDTKEPATKHEPFKFPSTHELDLVFPRGAGQHLTFRPSYTFPAIFALQNTDFPISFRPYLEVQVTSQSGGLKYAPPYVPYNASSNPTKDDDKNLNHATNTFVADLSSPSYHNWSSSSSASSSPQVQHLTFNLSSLIDLTVPGEYTLSWSFYAHNCSSSSSSSSTGRQKQKWGTSPYNNTWVVDHYAPQSFSTELNGWYHGTRSATFTITASSKSEAAADAKEAPLDPMNTKSWFDENWCPWDNVILRTTSEIKMSTPDPANPYPYHDDLSEVALGGYNIKNLTKEEWDEENSYCTVLAPPELGATSVEEEKTRKEVDKELRDGKPCRALLDQKQAEKVMSQFLGGMTLEEAVGKENAKESVGWRVVGPPVGCNVVGVVVVMGALGGWLLI